MLKRRKMERGIFEIVDTKSLVSKNHLLRKIDAAMYFANIYNMFDPLYCTSNGHPSIDPVTYEAHTACKVHGAVLADEATPGNVHERVAFDNVYDKVVEQFQDIHAFVADSAYKAPLILQEVFSDDRVLSVL